MYGYDKKKFLYLIFEKQAANVSGTLEMIAVTAVY